MTLWIIVLGELTLPEKDKKKTEYPRSRDLVHFWVGLDNPRNMKDSVHKWTGKKAKEKIPQIA